MIARTIVNTIVLFACAIATTALAQQPNQQPRTAGQVFKNIQVLKTMPASQLQNTMSFISASLGVDCSFCHTPPAMEKDDKATKQTARRMMLMMIDINKNFGDKIMVNCATCHRGQTKPAVIPPLPSLGSPILATKPTAVQAPLPTVDEILNRYVQTLGGSQAIAKINTRTRKGSVQFGAANGTFENYEAAPNKSLLKGILPPPLGSVHQVFDGQQGWVKNQGGVFPMSGDGLAQTKRESSFLADFKLKEQYKSMSVVGRERVGNREFYVVEATLENGKSEKLWFDVATGLLARKYSETTTYFGQLPNTIDYDDYRKVRNVLFPFTIRRVSGGNTILQFITDLKVNEPLDDSLFTKPQ